MGWKARVPVLAAALWWGSLTAIGFLAVPLLFAHATSPAVAGSLAARLFQGEMWMGIACGLLLLMTARDAGGTATMDWAGGAVLFVLVGVLAALLQEFAIAPKIVARQDLRFWHSAGTVAYAVQWVCALVVFCKVTAGEGRPGSPPARG